MEISEKDLRQALTLTVIVGIVSNACRFSSHSTALRRRRSRVRRSCSQTSTRSCRSTTNWRWNRWRSTSLNTKTITCLTSLRKCNNSILLVASKVAILFLTFTFLWVILWTFRFLTYSTFLFNLNCILFLVIAKISSVYTIYHPISSGH